MDTFLTGLRTAIQRNCDISDARHAGDYTLCIYLLKMREFYRWSRGLPLGAAMERSDIGSWVQRRETELEVLEDAEYRPIEIEGRSYSVFDNQAINRQLLPRGLVYSGGLGRFGKPCFFLAQLLRVEQLDGYSVLVTGRELARELAAPPAMANDRTIYIRRESLQRMLWERVEEWRWNKRENAMSRSVGCYDFDNDADDALESMTENELEAAILHEIGELVAGGLLGSGWDDMLLDLASSRAEILVRAVRDHLADCLTALPALLSDQNSASIHFYFGNLQPLRRDLFPTLSRAYLQWVDNEDLHDLKDAVRCGHGHWLGVARAVVDCHRRHGPDSASRIESLVESRQL